ncbi:unnamed protein product [Cladocopium goreaui]|uniref:Uncharacterized protein n=1 Tax=Cladocopium goreaui TaxID=2562237 RepID=A0A9P1CE68_9DINO|nr:unnamed protein product [Cladocopium goreaui]
MSLGAAVAVSTREPLIGHVLDQNEQKWDLEGVMRQVVAGTTTIEEDQLGMGISWEMLTRVKNLEGKPINKVIVHQALVKKLKEQEWTIAKMELLDMRKQMRGLWWHKLVSRVLALEWQGSTLAAMVGASGALAVPQLAFQTQAWAHIHNSCKR